MELFDFGDSSLLSYFPKNLEPEKSPQAHPQGNQKSAVIRILAKASFALNASKNFKSTDPFQITKYDEKLVEGLKKYGGITKDFKEAWAKHGSLESASKRAKSLQKNGILDLYFQATPKFQIELTKYKEKLKQRGFIRGKVLQQERVKNARQLTSTLSIEQKQLLSTLAEFRQMTPKQAEKFHKISDDNLAYLKEQGLIESKRYLVNQKPITLLTLSQRTKGKLNNGQDLARYGLGIEKPFAGIPRDQSKLLHDVSVVDAMEHAKGRYLKKGFQFVGAVSEHRLYGDKTSPNSDLGQRYADAYLIFRDSGGDCINVAVEFGNYSPSYLKEKLQGIQADQILVYTHDERRAHEYSQIIPTNTEVHIIQPQEIDR